MPELTNKDSLARIDSEERQLHENAGCLEIDIKNITGFRIGTQTPNKIRPNKIRIVKTRRDLLTKARNIKEKIAGELRKVIITADLTVLLYLY